MNIGPTEIEYMKYLIDKAEQQLAWQLVALSKAKARGIERQLHQTSELTELMEDHLTSLYKRQRHLFHPSDADRDVEFLEQVS